MKLIGLVSIVLWILSCVFLFTRQPINNFHYGKGSASVATFNTSNGILEVQGRTYKAVLENNSIQWIEVTK